MTLRLWSILFLFFIFYFLRFFRTRAPTGGEKCQRPPAVNLRRSRKNIRLYGFVFAAKKKTTTVYVYVYTYISTYVYVSTRHEERGIREKQAPVPSCFIFFFRFLRINIRVP